MREVSIIGIRRDFGFKWWLHLSMGRNHRSKVGRYAWGPPYAVANVQVGPQFFRFYAWLNNYGHCGSYISAFGRWTIGLAGISSTCDHQIWTHFLPNIHKTEKY